jgi:short-subunit dehydrogenase
VALSESLAHDLADTPIGVSVLAPAAVNTQIYRSGENRPARFGGPLALPGHDRLQEELKHGLDPDVIGERVVRAMRKRELLVFTHMETKAWLDQRHQRIRDAFDECAQWDAERQPQEPT